MSAPRCDEDFGDATPAVDWFNAEFHGDLAVIGDEEVQPSRRLGGFKSETYFTTADGRHIWDAFDQLKDWAGFHRVANDAVWIFCATCRIGPPPAPRSISSTKR